MRHNKKFNHLGRTASHRNAMLANMACSLIKHKRITTTVAKAKALKKFVVSSLDLVIKGSTNFFKALAFATVVLLLIEMLCWLTWLVL